jgi:DNA-binding response OmpR family regulator
MWKRRCGGSPDAEMAQDAVCIETPSAPEAPVKVADPIDGRRPRILLADDNADMRAYMRRLLSQNHYDVEAVANGREAWNAICRRRPDAVLSDVMMPEVDGFTLLAQIRASGELKDLPFILLSARAGEEAKIEGLGAGADDYLVKPFSGRELLARVAANLSMSRLRAAMAQDLRARTAELETVLETVPAAMWFTYDQEVRQVWSNRQAATLLRMPDGQTNISLGAAQSDRPRHFRVLVGGEDVDPRRLPLNRAVRGEETRNGELEIRFDDDSSVFVLMQASPDCVTKPST